MHKGGLGRGPTDAAGAGDLLNEAVGQALGAGMEWVTGGPHPAREVSIQPGWGRLGSNAPVLPPRTAARAWGRGGHGKHHPRPTPGPVSCLPPELRGRRGQEMGAEGHTGPWHTQACPLPAGEGSGQHQALPVPRCPHSPFPWWAEARKIGDVPPEPLPFLAWLGSVPNSCPSVRVPSAPRGGDRACRFKPLGPDLGLHRGWGGGQGR